MVVAATNKLMIKNYFEGEYMTTKELGKITFAEFGTVKDYPFLIGLPLCFKIGSRSVGDACCQFDYDDEFNRT